MQKRRLNPLLGRDRLLQTFPQSFEYILAPFALE